MELARSVQLGVAQSQFVNELGPAQQRVLQAGGFELVALPFSDTDRHTFSQLEISNSSSCDHFGNIEHVQVFLAGALNKIGKSDSRSAQIFVAGIAETFEQTLQAYQADAGWLCVRSFLANPFSTERWHTDGKFFLDSDSKARHQTKVAFCVRGASTLFARLTQKQGEEFDQAQSGFIRASSIVLDLQRNGADQLTLARARAEKNLAQARVNGIVRGSGEIVTPITAQQGAVFAVGQSPYSAIHSEPLFTEPRIFISIVPGSPGQIAELKGRWGG